MKRKVFEALCIMGYFLTLYFLRQKVPLAMEATGVSFLHSFRLLMSPVLVLLMLLALGFLYLYIVLSEGQITMAVLRFAAMALLGLAIAVPEKVTWLKETEYMLLYCSIYHTLTVCMRVLDFGCLLFLLVCFVLSRFLRRIMENQVIVSALYSVLSCMGGFLIAIKTVPYNYWYCIVSIAFVIFTACCMFLSYKRRQ